jgi:hypothetical protein
LLQIYVNIGVEGIYADVIFETVGSFVKIEQIKEGTRSVLGDRKLCVSIEEGDPFNVDALSLSILDDGYMVATPNVEPQNTELHTIWSSRESSRKTIRLVLVVGLLHGNGVLDLLSKI